MKYRQVRIKSSKYYFGDGKELATRDLAVLFVKKRVQKLKTKLAIQRIYHLSEVKIKEGEDYLQIIWIVKIPDLLNGEE